MITKSFLQMKSKGVIASLLALALPVAANATPVTVQSSGFEYGLTTTDQKIYTSGYGADERIGTFNFVLPDYVAGNLYNAASNPLGYIAVAVSTTFPMYDGDTMPGNIDEGHLVSTYGSGSTLVTLDELFLNNYPNNDTASPTNGVSLLNNFPIALDLTNLVGGAQGLLDFYITDLDEGGNKLLFSGISPEQFSLAITFDNLAPIPAPAILLLMLTGLLLLPLTKRTNKKLPV